MTSPPAWFSAALDAPVQQGTTTVDGASIAYRAWGNPDGRSIVLVHGGAAHSRWWDHIAPMLTSGWRVVAVDLSGHGDSDRRDRYSLDTWAREVLAVVDEAGSAAASVVIGHSMGGLVTLRLATLAGSQIAGAVAIDSPVRDMAPEDRAARQHRAFGPLRVTWSGGGAPPSLEVAMPPSDVQPVEVVNFREIRSHSSGAPPP